MGDLLTARRGLAALLVTAAFAPATAVASPGLEITGTAVTPEAYAFPRQVILYYLMLRTGAAEERFAVQLKPPRFATRGGLFEGQSVDGPIAVALQGPGTIGAQSQEGRLIGDCSSRFDRFHGYATGSAFVDVLLPPNSQTVLAARYETGARAPWPDTDLALRFSVLPRLIGRYGPESPFVPGPTLRTATHATTTGPRVTGRTGVHVLLGTRPSTGAGRRARARAIRAGRPVVVSGRVLPARKGLRLTVEAYRGTSRKPERVSTRTRAGGRFRATWRPRRRGSYELWVSVPEPPRGLVADTTSCPRRFVVK